MLLGMSESMVHIFIYSNPDNINYCSNIPELFLDRVNDGTTELERAFPSTRIKSTYMGNTLEQCHTTDMNYVACYQDVTRNQIMNNNATKPKTLF